VYITPAQLADSPRAQEIAQCATAENAAVVDTALMDAVLRGQDVSAFAPDQVEIAQRALDVVNALIVDACNLIDGFIGKRYTVPYPNDDGTLTVWARKIVRYFLHKDQISDATTSPIARDYKEVVGFLQLVGAGKFSLGKDDPTGSNGSGLTQVSVPGRVFTNDSLADFGGGL